VFENRVLRRIFGPKRDEVTGEWRRLHYEELYDLYSWTLLHGVNHMSYGVRDILFTIMTRLRPGQPRSPVSIP
jgi:hypothetical protein